MSTIDPNPLLYDLSGRATETVTELAHLAVADYDIQVHILDQMMPGSQAAYTIHIGIDGQAYLLDHAGTQWFVKTLHVDVQATAPERVPVTLRHHTFRQAHIAYGAVDLPPGAGLCTVVAQEGKPATLALAVPPDAYSGGRTLVFEHVGPWNDEEGRFINRSA